MMWKMSGFERMPTQDEVNLYDERWVSDLFMAYEFYLYYKSDDMFTNIGNSLARKQPSKEKPPESKKEEFLSFLPE